MTRIASPVRVRALAAVACCVAMLSGCTMCPDPYDYSGPVPNGSAPHNDFRARSNGIAPIGAAPRPWPPIVEREPGAAGAVVAAAEGSGAAAVEGPVTASAVAPVVGEAEPVFRR